MKVLDVNKDRLADSGLPALFQGTRAAWAIGGTARALAEPRVGGSDGGHD